jgi:Tol biopolymer transport system component
MSTERPLESRLHSILGEAARGPYPDYIDDVLAGTARRRQRPAWTFPERWLPMDIAAQPLRITRRVPGWGLAVLALLVVALLGAVALSAGWARVPPAYGRAANGLVAFSMAGDIQAVDVVTGQARPLIAGPHTDLEPVFSRDGTRFVFARQLASPSMDLIVARSDGTGLLTLTPTKLRDLAGWSFSPDGRFVTAIAMADGKRQILIVPSDGSAAPRFLDVGITDVGSPPQYRPDGSEILFVGKPNGARFAGLHAVDPATGVVRTIVHGQAPAEVYGAAWSPDGSRVAYGVVDSVHRTEWTHVIAADGTGDVRLAAPADVLAVDGLAWSNDGTRIVVVEATTQGAYANRSAVISVDGTGQRVVLDCRPDHVGFDCSGNFRAWSPDDSALIGSLNEGSTHWLADPVTGRIRPSGWGGEGEPAWQRIAP